jgi:hypothetical protein
MLKEILRRGYFPKELPTPFSTEKYADVIDKSLSSLPKPFSYDAKGPNYESRAFQYNVARRGKIRRPLAIPNPINFFHVAQLVNDNWSALKSHYKKSEQTISRPVFSNKGRAFDWEKGFELLPKSKLDVRNASRFIVKTDILNFYPSVYTHSIPWALHTKPIAKEQRRFHQNLGNKIDTAVRNGQEGQTKGIPIGPDTSFVVAEIIMTSIDESIISKLGTKYYRYVDDFEFGCSTAQEADNVLGYLQEIVADYELTLNPEKTNIIELPALIDPLWIHELGAFKFRDTVRGQQKDLLHYFDLSMDRFRSCGDDPVIKYAIKRTSSLEIKPENWSLYQSLLLQWAIAEPGVLPISIDFIKYHMDRDAPIDIDRVKETLQHIIKVHAARGHTSELAWSIWGMVLFQVPFDKEVVDTVADVENSVIALLCLDAQNQGLISKGYVFKRWSALMAKEELKGANWLLAYEALIKGWLPSLDGTDYIAAAEGFSLLRENKVHFYNVARTFSYKPELKYWYFKEKSSEYEAYKD